MSTATHRLLALLRRPISAPDRLRARWHLLDWYACARHGARDDSGRRWLSALRAQEVPATGSGDRIFSLGAGLTAADQALRYTAALGNIGEMDDVHRRSVLHPGPIVIPVALATAAQHGASAAALLDAVVHGYETTIRIGEALGAAHYQYYHSTATAGVFGAASAAASLLDLDDTAWCWALGNAGSVAGGLWQLRNEQVDTKQWHNAQAAITGQQAARLAACGISGPDAILEGPQGLLNATAAGGDVRAVDRDADDPWRLHDCSFKPWPACRHAHPVIDACLALRGQSGDAPIACERVHIETYADALTFCDRPQPRSSNDARFSLQYCAALALLRGEPTLEDFFPGAWRRPALVAMMARIEVTASDAFTGRYPAHFGARVSVRTGDGERDAEVLDTLGDPARPLDETAHLNKLRMLLPLDDVAAAQRWAEGVLNLPEDQCASALVAALEAAYA